MAGAPAVWLLIAQLTVAPSIFGISLVDPTQPGLN